MNQPVLNKVRKDKFTLVLDLPKILKGYADNINPNNKGADSIQFTVFGSPVPEISVPEIKIPFGGQNYFTSSNSRPAYPPLALKFFIDNQYINYGILWKWLNHFNDWRDSVSEMSEIKNPLSKPLITSNPTGDYVSSFTLFAKDEYNNNIASFTYYDAMLVKLSGLEFSHQDPDEIIGTATFVYNQLDFNILGDRRGNII